MYNMLMRTMHMLMCRCEVCICSTECVHLLNWKCANAQLEACTCSTEVCTR